MNWSFPNLQQPISSLPSTQLKTPLHCELAGMHCPLEHLNWFDVQSAYRKYYIAKQITNSHGPNSNTSYGYAQVWQQNHTIMLVISHPELPCRTKF